MRILWRPAAAFVMVALAASCGAADPGVGVLPFDQFVHGVETARYADYAGKPGVAVTDERVFEQMRQYLLGRYRDARVVSSYASGGAVFDCMPLAAAASAGPAPPPGSSSPLANAAPVSAAPGTAAPARQEHGCPDGAVPVRRVTLGQLVRFATLNSFFGKGPGGGGVPLPSSP
jgi:hypothetical protein